MTKAAVRISRLNPGMLKPFMRRRAASRPAWPQADFQATVDVGPQYTLVECFRDGGDARVPVDQDLAQYLSALIIHDLTPASFSPKTPWQNAGGLIDFRFYRTEAGQLDGFLDYYESAGFPVQSRVLGNCLGFFYDPPTSAIFHFWQFADPNDRAARRAKMLKLPEWEDYLQGAPRYLKEMNNWLLIPNN